MEEAVWLFFLSCMLLNSCHFACGGFASSRFFLLGYDAMFYFETEAEAQAFAVGAAAMVADIAEDKLKTALGA